MKMPKYAASPRSVPLDLSPFPPYSLEPLRLTLPIYPPLILCVMSQLRMSLCTDTTSDEQVNSDGRGQYHTKPDDYVLLGLPPIFQEIIDVTAVIEFQPRCAQYLSCGCHSSLQRWG